jgi:hypothetical protein
MARLSYSTRSSLDHSVVDTAVWETPEDPAPELTDSAAIWRAADKIVDTRASRKVASTRTTPERRFEPRALKASSERDLGIGGRGGDPGRGRTRT